MARRYKITFREEASPAGAIVCVTFANTRRQAERQARRQLRDEHDRDPRDFYTSCIEFVRTERKSPTRWDGSEA